MTRLLSFILLITGSAIWTSKIFCQDPAHISYTTANGLISDNVFYVMEDSKGNIWACTDKGVSKFDGNEFTNFGIDEGLDGEAVFICKEDLRGNIWFGTHSPALYLYDGLKMSPYKFNNIIKTNTRNKRVITSINFSNNGNLLIGFQYDGLLDISNSGYCKNLSRFEGKVLYNTGHGYLNYSFKSSEINLVSTPQITIHESDSALTYFKNEKFDIQFKSPLFYYIKTQNNILISSCNQLVEFENSIPVSRITLDYSIDCLYESDDDEMFIGLLGGGLMYYPNNIKGKCLKYFTNSSITSLIKDNKKELWIATRGTGIMKVYTMNVMSYSTTNNSQITDIKKGNNFYFIGLSNGSVQRISIENGSVENIIASKKIRSDIPMYFGVNNMDKIIIEIGKEEDFNINYSFVNVIRNEETKGHSGSFTLDSNDSFWISTQTNIYNYKNNRLKEIQVPNYTSISSHINCNKIVFINNVILLCCRTGLFQIEENYTVVRAIPYFNEEILDLVRFKGYEIIQTRNQGLLIKRNNTILRIPEINALKDISCIDGNNEMLMFVSKGKVFQVKLRNGIFDINELQMPYSINSVTKIKILGKKILFGYLGGFTVLTVEELLSNSNLEISSLNIKKASLKNNKHESSNLKDYYGFKNILLEVYRSNNNKVEDLKSQYKLNVENAHWTDFADNRFSIYNLTPGLYDIKFRSIKQKTNQVMEATSIRLRLGPQNQRNWKIIPFVITFLLMIVIHAFSLGIILINDFGIEFRKFKKEKNFLKLQALSAKMNPHFTFNILNSLQGLVLDNKASDSVYYISRYARLMRKILSNTNDPFIELKDEVELVQRYVEMENMRFGGKINFNVKHIGEEVKSSFRIPSMIIQPLVENSIKHGFKNIERSVFQIELKFHKLSDRLIVTVIDNGIGYSQTRKIHEHNKKSYGLEIVKDRLEILNQKTEIFDFFSIEDNLVQGRIHGTVARLIFPS